MAENRKPRELEDRLMAERPKQWQQAELLPEPDKHPDYAYRWIRVANLNAADPRNLSSKLRERLRGSASFKFATRIQR